MEISTNLKIIEVPASNLIYSYNVNMNYPFYICTNYVYTFPS